MIRLTLLLLLMTSPAYAQTKLQEMRSSDIVAEIEFLSGILPSRPTTPTQRLTSTPRKAFEDYLTADSICNALDYEAYEARVARIEEVFSSETPIKIGKRSYEIRASEGCSEEPEAMQIFEGYIGSFESYFTTLERREAILESLQVRRDEMIHRTLPRFD